MGTPWKITFKNCIKKLKKNSILNLKKKKKKKTGKKKKKKLKKKKILNKKKKKKKKQEKKKERIFSVWDNSPKLFFIEGLDTD